MCFVVKGEHKSFKPTLIKANLWHLQLMLHHWNKA